MVSDGLKIGTINHGLMSHTPGIRQLKRILPFWPYDKQPVGWLFQLIPIFYYQP